jgi:hypothetical protein
MIELKNRVLKNESTKSDWRNKHNSIEWKEANELNKFLYDKPLNKSVGCECLEDLFLLIKSKRINQQIKNKMEKKFLLKEGGVIQSKLGIISNSTPDEKCIELLTAFPGLSKNFKTLPSNWKELCSKGVVLTYADSMADLKGEPRPDNPTVEIEETETIDLDSMKVGQLKDYIEQKGGEVPEGKKAVILEYAKTL